jgi:shikimate kinase
MIISLIGMSNVGKSFWSKRLEDEQGFIRMCCDDLIADELSDLLSGVDIRDMEAFAAWMGMPYEFGYQEREAAYLSAEHAALERAIESIGTDMIIDTTGSVVYLPEALLRRLQEVSTVVYLMTTDNQLQTTTQNFLAHPKPLVWGQVFTRHAQESHEQALRRCYPELLHWRQSRYEALADVTIPHERRHDLHFTTKDLLHDVLQHQQ